MCCSLDFMSNTHVRILKHRYIGLVTSGLTNVLFNKFFTKMKNVSGLLKTKQSFKSQPNRI